MRIAIKAAMVGAALALAACGGNGDDRAAENVEDAAENQADLLEEMAENATNEAAEEALENRADAVEDTGEEKADAIDDSDGATNVDSNVAGM